ncbi:hypothetical protein [Mariniphaga sp.]|uniref:hypothetical protein n=1 Tax=Mariniphaga sp. TaxID=1954475 RepID=UPI0035663C85
MKLKKIKLLARFLLLLPLCAALLGAGCEKDKMSKSILNGKWILLGFGNDSTGEFTSEPDSEPKSSYVVFDNGELVAHSVSNRTFDMEYVLKEGNKIIITNQGIVTLVGSDTEWGQHFLYVIGNIFEFELSESMLKLYYQDQKFMKLKKETK